MEKILEAFIHNMNNKLMHVIGIAQILQKHDCPPEDIRRVETILNSSIEAAKLVEKLGEELNLYYRKEKEKE